MSLSVRTIYSAPSVRHPCGSHILPSRLPNYAPKEVIFYSQHSVPYPSPAPRNLCVCVCLYEGNEGGSRSRQGIVASCHCNRTGIKIYRLPSLSSSISLSFFLALLFHILAPFRSFDRKSSVARTIVK